MKKSILFIFIFCFAASGAFAGAWNDWEAYQSYKKSKKEASAASGAGNTATAVAKYLDAASIAEKHANKTIKGWQLNNAGYTLIKKFKADTNYREKIDKLSAMEPGPDKIAFQEKLADEFSEAFKLLEEAKGILVRAEGLFAEKTAGAGEKKENAQEQGEKEETEKDGGEEKKKSAEKERKLSGPMEKITSNLDFIDWVGNFIKDNK